MLKFHLREWYLQLSLTKRLRLYFLVGMVLILSVIFWYKIVPSGHITYIKDYEHNFQSGKGFIYNFTPSDRVDITSSQFPQLIGDPVYFSVFTPRSFSYAKVTVIYENNLSSTTPLLELGVLSDPIVWRYNLQPLENKILDNLSADWSKISDGHFSLFQKDQNYQSINDFLNDLENQSLINCAYKSQDCVATYNYQGNLNFFEPDQSILNLSTDTQTNGDQLWQIINPVSLRGDHNLYLYMQNKQPLELKIDLKPWSNNKPIQKAEILLFKDQKLIASTIWPENNGADTDISVSDYVNLKLKAPAADQGIYKLEIKISADVVIDRIQSTATAAVFSNKIWPVSSNNQILLFTDSSYLQTKAMNPASLQNFNFNAEEFHLTTAYQQLEWRLKQALTANQIILKKDNVILENNGVFAFTAEQLFNPTFKKIDRFFVPTPELKYILAVYDEPYMDAGQKEASAEFSLIGAYRENGKYNFMLSIPGLRAEDDQSDYLVIKKLIIELKGRSLFEKLFNKPDKFKL